MEKLTDEQKWQLDEIIIRWWDAEGHNDKRRAELECYKEFKACDFCDEFIPYLRNNDVDELADEMEHFYQMYQKVPHSHEKRLAA